MDNWRVARSVDCWRGVLPQSPPLKGKMEGTAEDDDEGDMKRPLGVDKIGKEDRWRRVLETYQMTTNCAC